MSDADSHSAEFPLESLWSAIANRAAVGLGAVTALASLVAGTPVWVASLRGAAAWFGVLVISRVFRAAVRDPEPNPSETEPAENPTR